MPHLLSCILQAWHPGPSAPRDPWMDTVTPQRSWTFGIMHNHYLNTVQNQWNWFPAYSCWEQNCRRCRYCVIVKLKVVFSFDVVRFDVSPSASMCRWDLPARWRGCLHVFQLCSMNAWMTWCFSMLTNDGDGTDPISSGNFTFLWLVLSLVMYWFVWWLTGWYWCM